MSSASRGRGGRRCRGRRSEGIARWEGKYPDPGVLGGDRWGREEALWHSANGSSESRRGALQRGAEGGHELVQILSNLQTRGARRVAVVEKRPSGIQQTVSNEGIAAQGDLAEQQTTRSKEQFLQRKITATEPEAEESGDLWRS